MIDIPVIDMCKTGQNIVYYRKQQGLSVKDLQNILGFANPNAIYKWQKGKSIPTVDNLIILSALFKVPIEDIIAIQKKYRQNPNNVYIIHT